MEPETTKVYNSHYEKYRDRILQTAKQYQIDNRVRLNQYQKDYRKRNLEAYKKFKELENIIKN
jgi:hypothetical protein